MANPVNHYKVVQLPSTLASSSIYFLKGASDDRAKVRITSDSSSPTAIELDYGYLSGGNNWKGEQHFSEKISIPASAPSNPVAGRTYLHFGNIGQGGVTPPAFTLNPATETELGGIKVGLGLNVTNDGVLSIDESNLNVNLDDVAKNGNETTVKLTADSVFQLTTDYDFVQREHLRSSGWSLQLDGTKVNLRDYDGFTISQIDISGLLTGDLSVTIDDTDPQDPELVFKQDGVEVGRVPASALLAGVARSATLQNYEILFRDIDNTTVYSVDIEPALSSYVNNPTITLGVSNALSGGGTFTLNQASNKTISFDLSSTTKSDIIKGVQAKEDIDNLEIGGRNLLLEKNKRNWAIASGVIQEDNNYRGFIAKVEPGQEYSLSRKDFSNNRFRVYFLDHYPEVGDDVSDFVQGDNKLKIEGFKAPNDAEYIFVYLSNEGVFGNEIKLEKGNKATDWTPAPEDQVTDYDEEDVNAFSYLKNRDKIASKDWSNDRYVRLTTNQTVGGQKTFTLPPLLSANATQANHAVRLSQVTTLIENATSWSAEEW